MRKYYLGFYFKMQVLWELEEEREVEEEKEVEAITLAIPINEIDTNIIRKIGSISLKINLT
ncbi:MAG: hypothetical protein WBF90_21095 [Rivularia sp. (in: cyanobacteria)]